MGRRKAAMSYFTNIPLSTTKETVGIKGGAFLDEMEKGRNLIRASKIIVWLYKHHEEFDSGSEWRQALVDYILKVLDVDLENTK